MALPVTITGISTAVAPVGPFAAPPVFSIITAQSSGESFGITALERKSQSFTPAFSSVASVTMVLLKTGAPTDACVIDVYAVDVNGEPTGSSLGTSSTVSGATVTTTATPYTFTFATPISITGGTKYAAVVSRTGAIDTTSTNYYRLVNGNASVDANEKSAIWTGSAWTTSAEDFYIVVVGTGSGGSYYFFGRDGTTATTLQAFKSTAPDTSWSSIATKTGFTTAILNIAGCQASNIIHLLVQHGTASTSLATSYLSFDAVTDTFLTTTETVSAAVAVTGQIAGAGAGASVVVRSNGQVVAFYSGVQVKIGGTFRAQVYYRVRTGLNTYGTETTLDGASAVDNRSPIAVLGASDRTHLLYFNGTNTIQRHLTSANVLGTAASTGATTLTFDACTYVNAGTTKNVGFTATQAFRWDSADNPTVTAASVTFGTPVRTIDDNLIVYALYQNSTDSDLYVKSSSDNGATFGSGTDVFTATVTAADANVSKNQTVYLRGTTYVFPYVVNDAGTLKYNEYTVRTTGPTGYTLPAATGAVTLNGPVNKLEYGHVATASAGAFALAGTTTGLKHGYTLAAVVGTFTLGGVAATTRYARVFPAATGPFVLAGQAAILRYARLFPAAAAAFALSGKAAALTAARFVRATVTTYALTGVNATLSRTSIVNNYVLPTTTGAFTLAGQVAAFVYRRVMTAQVGAFTLTGVAATPRAARTLPTVTGTFTLAGQTAIPRYGHAVSVTVGTFTLNGVAAIPRYGHAVAAATGTLSFAYPATGLNYASAKTLLAATGNFTLAAPVTKLEYGRLFPAATGELTLVGQTNILRYARIFPAAKATFTLNGLAAGLQISHRVTAIEGSFTLNGVAAALSYKRLMTAVKATFTLNGPATNLIWSGAGAKTMPAAPGVFVLSGKAATFKQTAVVKATVTTYALTGFPPTLAAGLRMTASTGSFISAGQAATFHYGRGFGAGAGAFVVTGKSASLLRLVINRYSMPAQAGAVSVGGNWVDLWRSGTEQPGSMHFGRVVYLHRW